MKNPTDHTNENSPSKGYQVRYLELCEDLSNPDETLTYCVTVGDESPEIGSPDDEASGYHFDLAEWRELEAALARGERYPMGNDLEYLDGFVVAVHD